MLSCYCCHCIYNKQVCHFPHVPGKGDFCLTKVLLSTLHESHSNHNSVVFQQRTSAGGLTQLQELD